jgi:hypothetical protein
MGIFLVIVSSALVIGVIAISIAIYLNDRDRRKGKGRSIALYFTGTLLSGIVLGGLFIFVASPMLCIIFHGEACNWVAGIVGIPAFFAVGAGLFMHYWVTHAKAP